VFPGSNANSTTGPDPVGSCGAMANDVWYAYTASCNGIATAEFCNAGNANYDTVLTAWLGSCGALSEIVCNDDSCGLQSHITFGVTSGTVYYISAGGFGGSIGTFNLSVFCTVPSGNDICAGAIGISEGTPVLGSNIGATSGGDPIVTSCGFQNGADVWYVVVPVCTGPYQATTCQGPTNVDTVLGIWDGTGGCGNLIAVACNDDDPTGCTAGQVFGLESRVNWNAVAGTPYYISVAGYFGGTGTFQLLVTSGSGLTLTFTNSGPGTIGYSVAGGPPGGSAFTAVTLAAGNFPAGWFFGIDIGFAELANEINTGFPFLVGLTPCGNVNVGPFGGLPSGLNIYGVTLGIPFGGGVVTQVSAPQSTTVP
jgi:hypothetical protein